MDPLRFGLNTAALPGATELARAVIDDMAHARWADVSVRFDPTMREGLADDELAAGWAHIVREAGAYRARGDPDAARRM